MKKIIFLIFFLGALNLKAQVADVIEIDSNTFEPSKSLPFDKRFILRVPIKDAEKVTFVGLVKHDRKTELDTTLSRRVNESVDRGKSYQIPEVHSKFYEVRKGDKKNYLQIDFRDSLLLDPSQHYSILYSTGVGNEVKEVFNTYNAIMSNGALLENDKVIALKALLKDGWNPISDAIKEATGARFGIEKVAEIDLIPNQLNILMTKIPNELKNTYQTLQAKYIARDAIISNHKRTIDGSSIYAKFVGNNTLSSYFKLISHKDAHFEEEYKKIILADKDQNQNIYTLIHSTQATYIDLLNGYLNISCLDCKPIKNNLFDKRIANLAKTIIAIREIEKTFFSLSQTDPSFVVSHKDIRDFIGELQNSESLLKEIIKANGLINDGLNSERNLHSTQLISGDSFVIGFDTRNKYSITPDFGLLSTVSPPEEFKQYPMLIPYLGFHINFRYVDKDQDFRSYRKKPLHYFSGFVGWSLKSIENKEKGISNFFNSSSLITGLGFRLGNAVRLTYSRLWYYQTPVNFSTPSLKSFGLIGLSLDMGLKDLTNGFKLFFP